MLIIALVLFLLGLVLVVGSFMVSALAWLLYVGVLFVLAAIPLLIAGIAIRARRRAGSDAEPTVDRYDPLAIVAFVLSFFLWVPAVVLGHIALSRLKRNNERGWGLAVASLILGYLGIAITFIALVIQVALISA